MARASLAFSTVITTSRASVRHDVRDVKKALQRGIVEATRWRCPPESSLGLWALQSARSTDSTRWSIHRWSGSGRLPAPIRRGNSTFSRTDNTGIRLKEWKMNPMTSCRRSVIRLSLSVCVEMKSPQLKSKSLPRSVQTSVVPSGNIFLTARTETTCLAPDCGFMSSPVLYCVATSRVVIGDAFGVDDREGIRLFRPQRFRLRDCTRSFLRVASTATTASSSFRSAPAPLSRSSCGDV